MWSHCIDLLAPSISIPAPSAAAESTEPLATVISLSSILNSVEDISVAEPKTVKSPVIVILPVNEPVLNVTSDVVDKSWLITSKFALFECEWDTSLNKSNLLSNDEVVEWMFVMFISFEDV